MLFCKFYYVKLDTNLLWRGITDFNFLTTSKNSKELNDLHVLKICYI